MDTRKGTRFELRVSEDFLKRLDAWRLRQPDPPSRASAIRELVEKQLAAEQARRRRR